jgi:hypothetical protein
MATARFQFFTRRPASIEWRLISANNWELGRCGAPVAALADSLAAVMVLQAMIDKLSEEVLPGGRSGWRWRLLLDDHVVAVASHSFVRRVECESTLAQFRRVARDAPLVPKLRTFGWSGTEMSGDPLLDG